MDSSVVIKVTRARGNISNAGEQYDVKSNSHPYSMNLFPLQTESKLTLRWVPNQRSVIQCLYLSLSTWMC